MEKTCRVHRPRRYPETNRQCQNAQQAAHTILTAYKPVRQKAGQQGPFSVRVMDTQTLFAGQGIEECEC